MKPEYSKELLAEMWKKLNLAREFETRVQWLFSMGLVHGTTHLGIGEEATAVGSILALKPQDYVFGTHRGHSQAIAKGIDIDHMMAEILAKEGKLPLRRLTGLRERDFGCWEGKSWQQVEAEYPDEFHLWREQPMVGIPSGGESRKSCEARSERAIRQILEETAGDAVIVAHGGILVFLMNYLLRFHREPQEIIVANASLSVVSYDRSTGMGKLLALNETGTLEQKKSF